MVILKFKPLLTTPRQSPSSSNSGRYIQGVLFILSYELFGVVKQNQTKISLEGKSVLLAVETKTVYQVKHLFPCLVRNLSDLFPDVVSDPAEGCPSFTDQMTFVFQLQQDNNIIVWSKTCIV